MTERTLKVDYGINPSVWARAERAAREEFDQDLRRMGFSEDEILALHRAASISEIAPGTLLRQAVLNAIGLHKD